MPEKIGKYVVLDVAGSGNMAVVYTGYDPDANRDVAIKVCDLSRVDERVLARQRKLFFNEVRTAQLLDHPNIVRVLDSGDQGQELFLVMEHVGGSQRLSDYCEPASLLPFEQVAQIGYTCARALDYAHRRGVIHRDIKPPNILLTPGGLLKIADFGVAQNYLAENTTQVLGILGSPYYMSPEQVRDEPTNGQTDIYSLGVTLFELLTGRRPFVARTMDQLVDLVLREPAPDVRAIRPEVPQALAQVVARALEKDLSRRYASGREMATELASGFAGLGQPQASLSDELRMDLTRQLAVFSEFLDTELEEVLQASRWHEYAEGERIPTEAWVEPAFFVVVSGEAAVVRHGTPILRLGRGDGFVDLGRLGAPDTLQVTASDDVTLLQFSTAALEQASVGCQLHFYKAFVRTLVERLTRAEATAERSHGGRDHRHEDPESGDR
jgi:serine/threonine protein kinase